MMTSAARLRLVLPVVLLLGVLAALSAAALASTVGWGSAIEVPGAAALGGGSDAQVNSVSCPLTGECAAVGYYWSSAIHGLQAFMVDEHGGIWGTATEVPGLAALSHGDASLSSVSCASPGNCAAGGYYTEGSGKQHPFVVDEQDGVWGAAIEAQGSAFDSMVYPEVTSVSCGGSGDCAAVGFDFIDGSSGSFVMSEHSGVWGTALKEPGVEASVSCGGVGECVAVGATSKGGVLVVERSGEWGKGVRVPGLGALSVPGHSFVGSVSCASPGNCAAAGIYRPRGSRSTSLFVADEKNGKWRNAIPVPTGVANAYAAVTSVSCTSAGNCAFGGVYDTPGRFGKDVAFVAGERKGRWSKAVAVRAPAGSHVGVPQEVTSVSCASAGNCAAVGIGGRAFAVAERRGVWGTALQVTTLGNTDSEAYAVSCARAGNCAIGGHYGVERGGGHAFVTAP